jgi:ankyrin repeat protein
MTQQQSTIRQKLHDVVREKLNQRTAPPPIPCRTLKPRLKSMAFMHGQISIVTRTDEEFINTIASTPRTSEASDTGTDEELCCSTPRTLLTTSDMVETLETIFNEGTLSQLLMFIEEHVVKQSSQQSPAMIGTHMSSSSQTSFVSSSPNAGSQVDDLQDRIKYMINKYRYTNQRCTGLHLLARSSNTNAPDMIGYLVDVGGVNVNIKDKHDATPLFYSCSSGNIETTAALLSRGAKVNLKDSVGHFPLLIALRNGHRDIVQSLVYSDADVNLTASLGNGCLHYLASKGDVDLLAFILDLQRGTPTGTVQLFAKNRHDETALYLCMNNPIMLSFLLDYMKAQKFIDPNTFTKSMKMTNNVGYNLLHRCAETGNVQSLSVLLEHIPDSYLADMLNAKDNVMHNTPLHVAVLSDNAAMVEVFAKSTEVNVNAQNKYGNTPLHLALKENLSNVFRIVLHDGLARINIPNNDGETCQSLVKNLPESSDNIIAMMVLTCDTNSDMESVPSPIRKKREELSSRRQRKSFAADLMKVFKIHRNV